LFFFGLAAGQAPVQVNLAVEFVDHAACAHIARNLGWYEAAGLNVRDFDNYATGMALSAALSRGDVDAAYICLLPAINAYANAGAPLKIVAGTHRYGYGLVVNAEKIKSVQDLSAPGIRIGCTSEGSPPAALFHKLVAAYSLDASLLTDARRMPPSKLLLSLWTGQIDAAFMPEQFPTMAESAGFRELVSAVDLWPGMQGSVLVVTENFLNTHPETVETLVALTARGIRYVNEHPEDAARIVAEELTVTGKDILPVNLAGSLDMPAVSPQVIRTSLESKLENTLSIDPKAVQEAIDYAVSLGYIKRAFPAAEILELRYLHE
jgi:NitT/TauT family transport system substrate-binding protein